MKNKLGLLIHGLLVRMHLRKEGIEIKVVDEKVVDEPADETYLKAIAALRTAREHGIRETVPLSHITTGSRK